MTPETTDEPGRVPAGAEPAPFVHPEGLPEAVADPAPLGRVAAGEPLYVVVNEAGDHLSHHRTAEGAQAAWDAAPDAAGIHETELHQ